MKITGWTFFENEKYIDVCSEVVKLRVEATKDIPKLPKAKEISSLSEKEIDDILKKREIMFNEALDIPQIKELDNLIEEITNIVIEDIRANNYHFTGETHQFSDFGTPIIDDKYILCVSQRSWGGIMAKAYPNEIDNSDGYGYVQWSWLSPDLEEIVPKKELWK